ncbi:MAG: glycoside hydrolase, partial [Acidobacteriaceae bacterium]
MNRRRFLEGCAAAAAFAGKPARGAATSHRAAWPVDGVALPDDGWNLWIDRAAAWEEDEIFLPADVDLGQLPVNAPTGGWQSLYARHGGEDFATVTLPTTVEEHFWGKYGSRPYTPEEYRYAADDPVPQNGAYRGVSWWWRAIEIPESMR